MFTHEQSNQVIHAIPGQPITDKDDENWDVLSALLDVLKYTPEYVQLTGWIPSYVQEDHTARWWTVEAPTVIGSLAETLNEYTPEGYWFGKYSYTDAYGFWLQEDNLFKQGWECTDPDTGQWAKKVNEFAWLYFDNNEGPENATLIDLREYTIKDIQEAILSYGYSLVPSSPKFIVTQNRESYLQMIAECLFETNASAVINPKIYNI